MRVVIDELDLAEIPKIVQRVRRRAGLPALSTDELAVEVQRILASEREMVGNRQILITPNAILEPNRDFSVHRVLGTVSPGADLAPLSLWQSEPDCHIGAAMRDGDQITLSIRVFSAVSAVVQATEEAWRYPDFGKGDSLGQFIALDPVTRQIARETTLSAEMERLFPRPATRPCAGPTAA
jgi:hypothetical protein